MRSARLACGLLCQCVGGVCRAVRIEGNVFIMFSKHPVFVHIATRNRFSDIFTVDLFMVRKKISGTHKGVYLCPKVP